MHLLLIVSNILLGASLAINAPDLAAATSAKTSKSHKLHQAHSKKTPATHPTDVWTRIRLGMKIPRAAAMQPQGSQKNIPAKQDDPGKAFRQPSSALKKTALGRMRFKAKKSPTTARKCNSPSSARFRQVNSLRSKYKTTQRSKKISSRMNFHPELRRPTGLAKPCAVLAQSHKNSPARPNDRINQHIAAYTQNPGFLSRVAERAQPYLYHIVEGLSKNRLPLELALLPIVESAYQATARSPKNAAGLWQFIPSTGKDFNLEQSRDYDERLDIPESTQAAIRFLSGLKNHYKGDWLLALAAYNAGQGTVDHAISLNEAKGLATDFWSLRLPEETRNYVPRLLALANIFAHPTRYGIKLPRVKNKPYFVKVKIDREFDINYLAEKDIGAVAKLANLNREQFLRLNPGYLATTLSRNDSYTFLLPPDNAKQLHQGLASIEQFITEPAALLKTAALEENPPTGIGFRQSLFSWGRLLASSDVTDANCSTTFLSLNLPLLCSKYS